MIAKRLSVRGRVQGVGFRYGAADAARDAGVSGWVRNCGDGSVEMLVQGPSDAVERIVAWSRRGPVGARVTDLDVTNAEPDPSLREFRQAATED